MRLCIYDTDRLGVVEGEVVRDASAALEALPAQRWPLPPGDLLIRHLDALRPRIEAAAEASEPVPLRAVRLQSPVANPSKIIGAPVNYKKHQEESQADAGINYGSVVKTIDDLGLFLKAPTSLVGPAHGVVVERSERRTDHEVELALVIGKEARHVAEAEALGYVAGYAIGLDMTVRGTEDRSYRKSLDTFSVLGPWLVTADEVADPDRLDLGLSVNGETRQASNTSYLIFGCAKLIAYASAAYTLYPGDVLMTGTPEGVAPVAPGDVMHAWVAGVGAMDVAVRGG